MKGIYAEDVRKYFEYKDGRLYWRYKEVKTKQDKIFNSSYAGKRAGGLAVNGYISIRVNKRLYTEHRLVWAYFNGYFPNETIDHVNHIRNDNRIENLREIPKKMQMYNTKLSKNNTSGHNGISWCKRDRRWIVKVMVNYKGFHRSCMTLEEAIKTRDELYSLHGFHENHGKGD